MVINTILRPLFIHLPLIFHRLLLDLICLLLREVGWPPSQMLVQFRVGIIGLTERLQSPGCHSCRYDDVHTAENNDALPMGNDTVQGGPAGVNLDAKKYEELISMGIAERVDKVPYLENQDNFVTSSIDREVSSDSFSPIYQIDVFGWLHMVQ